MSHHVTRVRFYSSYTFEEFFKLKGMTASHRNCCHIVWRKYQTSIVFQKQLCWFEQLTTLFVVQEVLYFFLTIHFYITMQNQINFTHGYSTPRMANPQFVSGSLLSFMQLLHKYHIYSYKVAQFCPSCSPWKTYPCIAWKCAWWLVQAHTQVSAFVRHTC